MQKWPEKCRYQNGGKVNVKPIAATSNLAKDGFPIVGLSKVVFTALILCVCV